jgi:hypothetical protein
VVLADILDFHLTKLTVYLKKVQSTYMKYVQLNSLNDLSQCGHVKCQAKFNMIFFLFFCCSWEDVLNWTYFLICSLKHYESSASIYVISTKFGVLSFNTNFIWNIKEMCEKLYCMVNIMLWICFFKKWERKKSWILIVCLWHLYQIFILCYF